MADLAGVGGSPAPGAASKRTRSDGTAADGRVASVDARKHVQRFGSRPSSPEELVMNLATLEDVLDVLKQRHAHCRQLLDLSRRQNRVIDASDYSSLLGILGQKQRILGRLDELKRRYPELSRQWTSLRDSGLPATRNDCESLIAETETILAELLDSEKQGTHQLSERREATRRQIEAVSQGVHVNQIYADSSPTLNHRFLNTKG